MQYFGGKHRIAKRVAGLFPAGAKYIEPFVGGASVTTCVAFEDRTACDANAALIHMWRCLQDGWRPPETVSECEYSAAKSLPDEDPLKAFIGFGCSFGGKWFGGYARGYADRNYAKIAKGSLLRKLTRLDGVKFEHADYRGVECPLGSVVYCDPPYDGTTPYGVVPSFQSADFWRHFKTVAEAGATVFVSEYAAPEGWVAIDSVPVTTDMRVSGGSRSHRTEHVFMLWDCASTYDYILGKHV